MAEGQKNILILGASFAGLSAAHYTLKHIIHALPNGGKDYHVTLVNPSATWFTRPAAPRLIVSEDLMPYSKTFLPIAENFKAYPSSTFTFIEGTAVSTDIQSRTVTVRVKDGGETTLSYYALIIATGAQTTSPILGIKTNSDDMKTAVDAFRAKLPTAKNIVIGGGGPAGVESAGEIGEFLNGKAGMFASRPAHPKAKITIVTGDKKLLPILRESIAKKAETYLNKVGVDVIYNTRVTGTEPANAATSPSSVTDKVTVQLSNGSTLDADLYIPATGYTANTDFLPDTVLDAKRRVETNPKTLRVDAAGPRVYAVGDVGSYTRGGVMDIYDAIPVALTNVKRDLLADASPNGEKAGAHGPDREFKPNLTETQLVPVGRSKGVGSVFGHQLPSIMVWGIKGRDYFTSQSAGTLTGSKWNKESAWKPKA